MDAASANVAINPLLRPKRSRSARVKINVTRAATHSIEKTATDQSPRVPFSRERITVHSQECVTQVRCSTDVVTQVARSADV